MRMLRYTIFLAAICLIGLGSAGNFFSQGKLTRNTGMFSWDAEYLKPENQAQVDRAMEAFGCGAVYQQVPGDADDRTVLAFLDYRHAKGQEVYYLAGAPEWGKPGGLAVMEQQVARVVDWNGMAGPGGGFAGIVWDIEPYLLDEWEDGMEELMESFVSNCCEAYGAEQGRKGTGRLDIIVCIPFFYDQKGLEEPLGRLIADGCDAVAVMNYNKNDEFGQIGTELSLARKYGKGIIHITEMQRPGRHKLTDNNTYFGDGIGAAKESWEMLKQQAGYGRLGFACHYINPVLELLEEDGN